MNDTRKDLPPITSPNFLEKVREALSVYLGNRGDKLDRGVTLRDLTDSGLVVVNPAYRTGSGGASPIGGAGPNAGGSYEIDLTPPPIPSGFVATAAISNLLVECSPQTYTQGNGHAKSVLYGATWSAGALPVFSNSVVLTEFSGTVASHATNPSTTWHLWLKWVTVDGVYSTSPAGGTNGVVTRTGEDVALLLEALTGELTESQLFSSLGNRIDLIDGASGLAGSVNARVLAEATARGTAIQSEATARSSADGALATRVDTVVATATTDRGTAASAIQSEATARANADAAEASARTTLASTVDGNTSAIQTEASTRATQTGDLFAQYTVKVDTNGYVSGYGLANVVRNGTPTSEFIIRADNFSIAPVNTSNTAEDGSPFFYRTSATVINGVSIPAGAHLKAAYIHAASITTAKIADLAVDNAKIADLSAAKINAGFLDAARISVGSLDAKIANLDTAVITSGIINAARINTASIANATISTAQIASATIGAAQVTGTLTASQINGTNLAVVNGSFSGSLSSTSGSFSGTLTADAINAVNTINIAGNAATICQSGSAEDGFAAVAFNLNYPADVFIIANAAHPNPLTITIRVDGVDVGPSEYIQGTAIVTRKSNLAAGWHVVQTRSNGVRSGIIIFASIR
jgi:hypothetical protein